MMAFVDVDELRAVARAIREEVPPFAVRAPDLDMTSHRAALICTEAAATLKRYREALEAIEYRSTNHGGWFDQRGQQFVEYCKLGGIARQALEEKP